MSKVLWPWNPGQRSLKVVPFNSIGYGFLLVFYSNFVPKMKTFLRYSTLKNVMTSKSGSKVIKTFLLTFHSNHGPILYSFRDKRQFQGEKSQISPCILHPRWRGSSGNWVSARGHKNLNHGATGPWKKFDDILSRLDKIHQRDGRTDTLTQQRTC